MLTGNTYLTGCPRVTLIRVINTVLEKCLNFVCFPAVPETNFVFPEAKSAVICVSCRKT